MVQWDPKIHSGEPQNAVGGKWGTPTVMEWNKIILLDGTAEKGSLTPKAAARGWAQKSCGVWDSGARRGCGSSGTDNWLLITTSRLLSNLRVIGAVRCGADPRFLPKPP